MNVTKLLRLFVRTASAHCDTEDGPAVTDGRRALETGNVNIALKWVHQVDEYDTQKGMSFWRKNYRTSIEAADTEALSRDYVYYDPIYTLPESGQQWWLEQGGHEAAHEAAVQAAAASREASLV